MDKYQKRILSIFVCNIIDTIATLLFYSTGLFIELNPVMRYFLQTPILFVIFKMGIVIAILYKLWHVTNARYARIAINICWIEYLLLALYYFNLCIVWFIIF